MPTTCYGCHQTDFNGTTNPNHVAVAFPTTCDTCHGSAPLAWTPVTTFNHTLYANWALTGAHATVTCAQCHTNNNYATLTTACYGCHQADFTGTTNPPHVASGFPTDCTICHSTTNWTSSTFNHSTTSFPLTGFHATMQCVQCHTSATTYNGSLPTACYGCHTADYNGTTNPSHSAAGFPTTCDTCHTTTSWAGATFNHNNTPFPLTGAHTTVSCILCHVNNVLRARRLIATPATVQTTTEPPTRTTPRQAGRQRAPHANNDRVAAGNIADFVSHLLPPQSRKCQRRVHHLPHQLGGLFRVYMHWMSRR